MSDDALQNGSRAPREEEHESWASLGKTVCAWVLANERRHDVFTLRAHLSTQRENGIRVVLLVSEGTLNSGETACATFVSRQRAKERHVTLRAHLATERKTGMTAVLLAGSQPSTTATRSQ